MTNQSKKINKLERRIKTLKTKIKENQTEINQIREYSKGKSNIVRDDEKIRKRNIKRRKKLDAQNKKYRKELKEKRKELTEKKKINKRIENMHDCNEQKGAIRRFNTIYNQLNQFDDDTQKFLKNLNKTRTNNKIEGYFKITLPKYLKRIYRTKEGLIHWIRLQKIRWTERNVLTQQTKNFKNQSNTEKIENAS